MYIFCNYTKAILNNIMYKIANTTINFNVNVA